MLGFIEETNTMRFSPIILLLLAEAERRGYEPDSTVCATDVPARRV